MILWQSRWKTHIQKNRKEKLCFKIKCYDKLTMKTKRSLDNYKLNGNFLDDKQHQNGINDDFLIIFMCDCDGVFLCFRIKRIVSSNIFDLHFDSELTE